MNLSLISTEEFFKRVDKTEECWLWTGGIKGKGTEDGYGLYYYAEGKHWYAHRVSWRIHYGPIPTGKKVLHKCDVRRCVKPEHLFLGTQLDNIKDMTTKGRVSHGVNHYHARMSEEDVLAIIELCRHKKQSEVATMYGIRQPHVSRIITGRAWRRFHENNTQGVEK